MSRNSRTDDRSKDQGVVSNGFLVKALKGSHGQFRVSFKLELYVKNGSEFRATLERELKKLFQFQVKLRTETEKQIRAPIQA